MLVSRSQSEGQGMKCLRQEVPGVGTPPLDSQVFKSLRNTRHCSSIFRCFSQNNSLLMHHSCDIQWLCFCLDLEGIKNTCTTLHKVKLVVEGGGDKKIKEKYGFTLGGKQQQEQEALGIHPPGPDTMHHWPLTW